MIGVESLQIRIRKLRTERKWSQQDLSKRVGVSQPTIAEYEKGKINPSRETCARIAQAFEVSLDYLLGYSDTKGEPPYRESSDVIDIREIKRTVIDKKMVYGPEEIPEIDQEIIKRFILDAVRRQENKKKHKED